MRALRDDLPSGNGREPLGHGICEADWAPRALMDTSGVLDGVFYPVAPIGADPVVM